jgi:hypothetical protein
VGVENAGQGQITQFPGVSPQGFYSTGLPGSEGITAAATAGPVVGTPVVSVPFASSQPAASRPVIAVTSGDTFSASDDLAVHVGTPLLPAGADTTGIGGGHAGHRP